MNSERDDVRDALFEWLILAAMGLAVLVALSGCGLNGLRGTGL